MAKTNTYETGAINDIFAHTGIKTAPSGGYILADAVTGEVKRGMPLKRGATAYELLPIEADADLVVAVAAATVDTEFTKAMPAYEEGEFNAHVIEGLLPSGVTIAGLYANAAKQGIYFRDVVKAV